MAPLSAEEIVYIVMNVLFAILTFIGNTLILLAVLKTISLRSPSNYFICSLAVGDIVVGLFVNTNNALLQSWNLWHTEHELRRSERFFYIQTIVVSTLNLCAVSIDRYIAVSQPLRYQAIMTDQKCYRIIMFIWTISILSAASAAFLQKNQLFILWTIVLISGYLVPLTVIVYCYYCIIRIASYQQSRIVASIHLRRAFEEHNYRDVPARSAVRGTRAATTFGIITAVFVITFTPDLVLTIYNTVHGIPKGKKGNMLNLWLHFLLYTSSAINPIIYGFRNRDVRIAVKKLCYK